MGRRSGGARVRRRHTPPTLSLSSSPSSAPCTPSPLCQAERDFFVSFYQKKNSIQNLFIRWCSCQKKYIIKRHKKARLLRTSVTSNYLGFCGWIRFNGNISPSVTLFYPVPVSQDPSVLKLSWKLGASQYTPSLCYSYYSKYSAKPVLQTPSWLGSQFWRSLKRQKTLRISARCSQGSAPDRSPRFESEI